MTEGAVKQIKGILSKDLPEDLKHAMVAGIVASGSSESPVSTNVSTGIDSGVRNARKGLQTLAGIIQNPGDVGQAVAMSLSKNWIGLILMLVAKLVSALESVSEDFSAFMDSISTIMRIAAETIKPLVEDLVRPFLDGMQNLGRIIGSVLDSIMTLLNAISDPVLDMLTQSLNLVAPIVESVNTLLKLFIQLNPVLVVFGDVMKAVYNHIMVPVVNFLLKIMPTIGNFFIRMYNGVTAALNSIEIFGWKPFNFGKKNEVDYGSMKLEKIDRYSSYGGGSGKAGESRTGGDGSGASYTAARDTYVNIYFSNSFVKGDAEQIAITLAREIRRAEAKNLV